MSSIKLPYYGTTPEQSVPELLAFSHYYLQVSGILKAFEGEVFVGTPIAIESVYDKFVKYDHDGSGGAEVCVGFVRIPGDSTLEDVAIEVVIGGAVKYSLVSVDDEYDVALLTDLKARINVVADALIF